MRCRCPRHADRNRPLFLALSPNEIGNTHRFIRRPPVNRFNTIRLSLESLPQLSRLRALLESMRLLPTESFAWNSHGCDSPPAFKIPAVSLTAKRVFFKIILHAPKSRFLAKLTSQLVRLRETPLLSHHHRFAMQLDSGDLILGLPT